jgi:hypothetical protein
LVAELLRGLLGLLAVLLGLVCGVADALLGLLGHVAGLLVAVAAAEPVGHVAYGLLGLGDELLALVQSLLAFFGDVPKEVSHDVSPYLWRM